MKILEEGFTGSLNTHSTVKNTVISPDFLVWKFFPQNFHTRKSGEITVFFAA